MIEAKNKSEFLRILKVISEEAVSLSKKSLNESTDPYVEKYSTQFKNDQKLYGRLSEQDVEELPPLEDEEGEEGGEEEALELEDEPAEPEAEEDLGDEEPAEGEPAEEEADASTEEFGVSFDSVLDAINNLRAGRSLKDTNIKDQTSAYYDRLDDPERKVLLVFLKQLSEILQGAVQGAEAKDPSDLNLSVTDGSAEEDAAEGEGEGEEEVITDEPEAPEEPGEEPGEEPEEELEPDEEGEPTEEDTSPPIRVDENQDIAALKKRIRRLMMRG